MDEKTKDCLLNVIILISKVKILPARIRGLVTDVSCVESTAILHQVNVSVQFRFRFNSFIVPRFFYSLVFRVSGFGTFCFRLS